MKVCIIGHSGSGKSTLADKLGLYYNAPVLHLDSLNFSHDWIERPREEFRELFNEWVEGKESWIIDGNYTGSYPERFKEADMVIYLDYNRFFCLNSVFKRLKENKGKVRSDMAPGCYEKVDFEFVLWVLYKGRTKKKRLAFEDIVKNSKKGLIFKSRKDLFKYLDTLNIVHN